MAEKFAKEEKYCYDSNTDDSEGEANNSKSRSGSNSPTTQFEDRVMNDLHRGGGPCAPNACQCHHCGCENHLRRVDFTCNHYTYLCNCCYDSHLHTCPVHPMSGRKYA